jgi:NAD(P)H-hydrate epimerase
VKVLLKAEAAGLLDKQAQQWGFDVFALVEAAGRACACALVGAYPEYFTGRSRVTVFAGSGNNGADAMVALRALVLWGRVCPSACSVIINRESAAGERNPRSGVLLSLKKMGVPVAVWAGEIAGAGEIAAGDLILDGVAGTGLRGALSGIPADMVRALNAYDERADGGPLIVSVDVPSGNFDGWKPGMPIVRAGAVLAIEPRKACLYTPAARPYGGRIVPVGGIFPERLIAEVAGLPGDAVSGGASSVPSTGILRLFSWEEAAAVVPPIAPDAYKHSRGLVEIRAGSRGACGAARIAARGAQAAGAGLVRLVVDPSIHAILAAKADGIMVVPDEGRDDGRFTPDAVLLGPGWGNDPGRERLLEQALEKEAAGVPLILDADAITLSGGRVFHGNAILTPHPGEFAALTGCPKEAVLADPLPFLLRGAEERKAVILFKGHVLYVVSYDGRAGVIDGMLPSLAAGGSGDLLAGFCAAIAARLAHGGQFDGFACAVAAAALLMEAGKADEVRGRFTDPLEIAGKAASVAGAAWLPGGKGT